MKNYLKKFDLRQRVAFVTGGAGLLGSEIAKALASVGARIVILDNNQKAGRELASQITSSGGFAFFELFDMAKLETLEVKMKSLVKKYKGIDTWINCSYPRTKDWYVSVEKTTAKSLKENVNAHLNSYLWTSRVAALEMKRLHVAGSIVNFGSIYGVQANDFTIYEGTNIVSPITYYAIKGGIVNVTRYLASYFGKFGIRVNSVCPGAVQNSNDKRFIKNFTKRVPLKRLCRTDEVAAAVLFLASDASSYMTGTTMMVDGGWSIV